MVRNSKTCGIASHLRRASFSPVRSQLLLGIPEDSHSSTAVASGLPRNRLFLHGFLTVLVPYIHTRLRNNAMSGAWPEAPSSDRRRKLWDWMTSAESTHATLSLVSFVIFLWNGRCVGSPKHRYVLSDRSALCRYRTLTDRLLQMRLAPARKLVKRNVSYEFMNRQMVWHAFTVSNPECTYHEYSALLVTVGE